MTLAEPMTVATDYVLAALGVWLGRRLWVSSNVGDARRLWALSFWTMSVAAFLGGTSHGFRPMLTSTVDGLIWRATMVAIGGAAVLLALAALRVITESPSWKWILFVEFVIYAAWVCFIDPSFVFGIIQYGSGMIVVLVIHAALAARRRAGALWVVAGVLVSFLGAGVQMSGFSLHRHFNHNDLYHVIQMVGLYLLYRGAASGTESRRTA